MLSSRKFLIAKKFMGEGWGGFSRFSVENCCLTLPKKIVGEPVIVSQSFRYPKNLGIRGGGVSRFSVENVFISQGRKSS